MLFIMHVQFYCFCFDFASLFFTIMLIAADICSFLMRSGSKLATVSGDTTAKIWDFARAECVHTFTEHTHAVWGCTWHACGDFLATCSMDNTSKVWDINR